MKFSDWAPFHDIVAALIVVTCIVAAIVLSAFGKAIPTAIDAPGAVALGWLFRGASSTAIAKIQGRYLAT